MKRVLVVGCSGVTTKRRPQAFLVRADEGYELTPGLVRVWAKAVERRATARPDHPAANWATGREIVKFGKKMMGAAGNRTLD
jgi:hypothetical protein